MNDPGRAGCSRRSSAIWKREGGLGSGGVARQRAHWRRAALRPTSARCRAHGRLVQSLRRGRRAERGTPTPPLLACRCCCMPCHRHPPRALSTAAVPASDGRARDAGTAAWRVMQSPTSIWRPHTQAASCPRTGADAAVSGLLQGGRHLPGACKAAEEGGGAAAPPTLVHVQPQPHGVARCELSVSSSSSPLTTMRARTRRARMRVRGEGLGGTDEVSPRRQERDAKPEPEPRALQTPDAGSALTLVLASSPSPHLTPSPLHPHPRRDPPPPSPSRCRAQASAAMEH